MPDLAPKAHSVHRSKANQKQSQGKQITVNLPAGAVAKGGEAGVAAWHAPAAKERDPPTSEGPALI